MPTAIPTPYRPVRRLSWPETGRFLVLIVRVRWLNYRLHAAHRRVERLGQDAAGGKLLSLAYRWLDTHEEIARLLGIEAPPQVRQVRVALIPVEAD